MTVMLSVPVWLSVMVKRVAVNYSCLLHNLEVMIDEFLCLLEKHATIRDDVLFVRLAAKNRWRSAVVSNHRALFV